MKIINKSAIAATALVVSGLLAAPALAETKWLMSANNPDGNYHTENAKQFAADVAEATGGELMIEVYPGAELLKSPEMKRGVQTGVVQIADSTMAVLGNDDPIFELDSIPLLATSFDEAKKLWDVSREATKARLDQDGLVLLYAVPWPPQGIYSTNEITAEDSLAGVRFRTYSALTSKFATGLGANPVTVNAGEIPQAFSAGLVDAMITSAATGVDYQAWDFVKNYYDVGAAFPKQIALMNKDAFSALPAEVQTAVLEAGEKAEARGWEQAISLTGGFKDTFIEHGMNYQGSPEVLAGKFETIGSELLAEWLDKAGDSGKQIIDAYEKM